MLFSVVQADLTKERVVTREQGEKLAKVSFLKYLSHAACTSCMEVKGSWQENNVFMVTTVQ